MPHIHTQPGQHDATASAMIVRYENDVPYALLIRHKKYNRYIQPGGHVELHESPWQAVLHEIEEETGYELNQLTVLQPIDSMESIEGDSILHPMPAFFNTHLATDDHFHSDTMFIFIAMNKPFNVPAEGESQDLLWVDRKGLLDMSEAELFLDTRQMLLHAFDNYIQHWRVLDLSLFNGGGKHV